MRVCGGRRFVVQVQFPNDVARPLIFLWQAAPGKEISATGSALHGRPLFWLVRTETESCAMARQSMLAQSKVPVAAESRPPTVDGDGALKHKV